MAQIDPRLLLQAAMMQGGDQGQGPSPMMQGGVPGSSPMPGDPSGGGPPMPPTTGPDPATQPTGAGPGMAPDSGGLSNANLAAQLGTGSELQQEPDAMQSMVAMLNDPNTPPDQKEAIKQRLQLAALQSIAAGPSGAVGSPQGS